MEVMVWTVLVIILTLIELITVGLTSIWFAGGALAALIVTGLGVPVLGQIAVFFIVSFTLLCFTRPWVIKFFWPKLEWTNYAGNIGKDVCLTETVDNIKGTGTAVLNGQEWTARAYDGKSVFEAGTVVKVAEIRGVTMYVTDSDSMPKVNNLKKGN